MLLPLGAIEQHGPHLPLLVDLLGAEVLARLLAPRLRRAGWTPVLAPSVPYGVSPLAEGWSGTVSLSRGTLERLVVEIVRQLGSHGFRRFVLVNYQADPGHLRAMATIRARLARRGVPVLFAGFAPPPRGARVSEETPMTNRRVMKMLRSPKPAAEWHSGELETAMVLWARPDLVRRARARRLAPVWVDVRSALARGARNFRDLVPRSQGYFGAPAVARAETARKVMGVRARLIAREIIAALGRQQT